MDQETKKLVDANFDGDYSDECLFAHAADYIWEHYDRYILPNNAIVQDCGSWLYVAWRDSNAEHSGFHVDDNGYVDILIDWRKITEGWALMAFPIRPCKPFVRSFFKKFNCFFVQKT